MEGYKYYSTQRPVGLLTYLDLLDSPPVEIKNYDCDFRISIPRETLQVWGELTYAKPLTEK